MTPTHHPFDTDPDLPFDTDPDLDLGLTAEPSRWQSLRRNLADLPRPTQWYVYPLLALAVVAAASLLWLAVTAVIHVVGAVGDASTDLNAWLTGGPITRTITGPVHAYLDTHAAGLPATAGQLWTAWLLVTGGLFVGAVLGGRGARIGWAVLGALSVAMVHAGTTGPGRHLAAGVTATVWAVLSIAALRRTTTRTTTVINQIHTPGPAGPAGAARDVDDVAVF